MATTAPKIDFADVLKMAGENDPAEATGLLKLIQQIARVLPLLAAFGIDVEDIVKGAIEKWRKEKTSAPSAPAPSPQTPSAPPSSAPVPSTPSPSAPAPSSARVIGDLSPSFFWYQPTAGSPVVSKEEFQRVVNREDPMVPRSRMAIDCDTIDQFGKEIRPEHWTAEMRQELLWWPADAPDGLANTPRIRWFFEGGDGVANFAGGKGDDPAASYDGTLITIKIGKDALEQDNHDYETGQAYCKYTAPDGRRLESVRLPSLRAKR